MTRTYVPLANVPDTIARFIVGEKDVSFETLHKAKGQGPSAYYRHNDWAGCVSHVVSIATGRAIACATSQPGGANPFSGDYSCDLTVPPGCVVVHVYGFNKHTFCYCHAEDLAELGAEDPDEDTEDLPLEVRAAISVVCGIRGGYRKVEAERYGLTYSATDPAFAEAIARGYLKANKRGAMTATAKGKNTRRLSYPEHDQMRARAAR